MLTVSSLIHRFVKKAGYTLNKINGKGAKLVKKIKLKNVIK